MRLGQDKPNRLLSADENDARWEAYGLDRLADQHPLAFFDQRWLWERPLYARVCSRVRAGGRILEVGCGLGANAVWFAAQGYEVVGVDYLPALIDAARAVTAELRVDCSFAVADAFDLSAHRGFDLAVSFGMIEHWRRPDTVRALREQAASARQVVAIVPTPNTHYTGEITDEHFYSRRQMRAIFLEAGLSNVVSYSYGKVPSRLYRTAEWMLPGPGLKALRAWTLRFSMAQATFGVASKL
jgi:2-polyprenyl-3-methyl-5-hydroxy-6-metoxy-1,4-benzoquinol methylase